MISATTRSTFSSASRLRPRNAANSCSKPGAEASSLSGPTLLACLSGTTHLTETVDPAADALRLCLERGAVDDEARGHIGDVLDLDQPVVAQGAAAVDQVDDAMAEAKRRRELHRARELDAFGLHAARGEVAARHLGILGGDAHMAPAPRIVTARHLGRLGDRQPALADAEIDRRVDLGIVELH